MSDLSRLLAALEASSALHADLLCAINTGVVTSSEPEALAAFSLRLADALESARAVLLKRTTVTR